MLPILASIISSLIAGGLPSVAKVVIDKGQSYVEEKLGVTLKPDMSAEELAKISEAATKHEEFLVEQNYKDIADARDMQKESLKQEDIWTKRFLPGLTILLILLASFFIYFVTFGKIPPENINFVGGFVEFIKVVFATIVGFWYGSSNGSVKKTALLAAKEDK
jgi:hypothetical protein